MYMLSNRMQHYENFVVLSEIIGDNSRRNCYSCLTRILRKKSGVDNYCLNLKKNILNDF